jgi:N-acetylglucosamine kinase-like BadF-type ATPase
MSHYLGVDVGGTKTHALIADGDGHAVGFASGGPGNWEVVGYDGFTAVLQETIGRAAAMAGVKVEDLAGAGMGIGGYDWPSQRQAHLEAIRPVRLRGPVEIVNDATLGILAGSSEGWGISVVSGTGCNARGWSRDHKHEGRVVGGGGYWSGEAAGGGDIVARAMRAVTFEWARRGPATALSQAFLQKTGARDLFDLVEGVYVGRYDFDPQLALLVFQVAAEGDPEALAVMRWAGNELGLLAVSVINQLDMQQEAFDVVLIGSIYNGHPLLTESMAETIHRVAPAARLVRLNAPPVVGGVLLGMEQAGRNGYGVRDKLIETTCEFIKKE